MQEPHLLVFPMLEAELLQTQTWGPSRETAARSDYLMEVDGTSDHLMSGQSQGRSTLTWEESKAVFKALLCATLAVIPGLLAERQEHLFHIRRTLGAEQEARKASTTGRECAVGAGPFSALSTRGT